MSVVKNNEEKAPENLDTTPQTISSGANLQKISGIPLERIKAIVTTENEEIPIKEADEEQIRELQFFAKFRIAPLPPPEEFAKYEEILTGAADRILSIAERQAGHRQLMENKKYELEAKTLDIGKYDIDLIRSIERRGQTFGFILAIILLAIGAPLVLFGHDISGTTIIVSCLVGLAAVFVIGKKKPPATNSQ